jgi:chemotaxis protein MotB
MEHAPVIRIVKKKIIAGGHHGGSWKVAYADFVTAMMAFFLVMWIISMDQPVREKIQDYFNDPSSASITKAGISKLASGGQNPVASGFAGAMDTKVWTQASKDKKVVKLDGVRSRVEKALGSRPDLSHLKANISTTVDAKGLLIELMEGADSRFFASGSAAIPSSSFALLGIIAKEIRKLPNPVVIEGHTDVQPYSGRAGYSNWELSTDRANAARRAMEAQGLRNGQVVEVRGYASSLLRDPNKPYAAHNRRVAIRVLWDGLAIDKTDREREVAHPSPLGLEPLAPSPSNDVHVKVQPHL